MGMIAAVFAMTAATVSLLAQPPVRSENSSGDPVLEACIEAGGTRNDCFCVSRELRSRFTPRQITVIAEAIPDVERVGEPQSLVDELGFTFDQILNLRQRAMRADPVIRAACGRGLSGEN